MKACDAIVEVLKREGVDVLFGYPRNALLEAAAQADVRTIIVRQERTGLHMADALSRLTRGQRMGVFCMQQGPGTENAYGGVAQAFTESVPVLVLPAGYPRRLAHVGPSYNATISMATIVKTAEPLTAPEEVGPVFRRAFTQLRNGRLRPVLVELPLDVIEAEGGALDYRPVVRTRYGPDPAAVAKAAGMLCAASRPVIYAGQGVHWANAYAELRELAELLAAPVCTSLEGKSCFDETHPLALGSGGAATPLQVRHFLDNADLILGIGCSFAATPFGVKMPEGKRVIHATLDPAAASPPAATSSTARATIRAPVHDEIRGGRGRVHEALAAQADQRSGTDHPLSRAVGPAAQCRRRQHDHHRDDAGSPRDQLSPFWKTVTPLSYIGWGQVDSARLWPGAGDGRQARASPRNCASTCGAMPRSASPHGFRDGGAASGCRSCRSCSTTARWRSSSTSCRWRPRNTARPTSPAITPTSPGRSAAMASA